MPGPPNQPPAAARPTRQRPAGPADRRAAAQTVPRARCGRRRAHDRPESRPPAARRIRWRRTPPHPAHALRPPAHPKDASPGRSRPGAAAAADVPVRARRISRGWNASDEVPVIRGRAAVPAAHATRRFPLRPVAALLRRPGPLQNRPRPRRCTRPSPPAFPHRQIKTDHQAQARPGEWLSPADAKRDPRSCRRPGVGELVTDRRGASRRRSAQRRRSGRAAAPRRLSTQARRSGRSGPPRSSACALETTGSAYSLNYGTTSQFRSLPQPRRRTASMPGNYGWQVRKGATAARVLPKADMWG
jgi:hypothetical protein